MANTIYTETPVSTNLFTQTMLKKYVKFNNVRRNTAFMSFFGNTANGSLSLFTDDATHVTIPTAVGKNSKSKFGTRGIPASIGSNRKNRQGTKFQQSTRQFPIIKDTGDITAIDSFTKAIQEIAGEAPLSRMERIRIAGANIYRDIMIDQIYQIDFLAGQSILTGQQPVDEKGGYFDFGRDADNAVTAALPWTNASSTPLKDVDEVCSLVDVNGRVEPDFVGMDVASFEAFINHADVKEIADNRRYEFFAAGDKRQPESKYDRYIKSGWKPRGYLTTASGYSVWIFTTTGTYEDENGDRVKVMPNGTIFATSTETRNDRLYGPDDKLPEVFAKMSVSEQLFGIAPAVIRDPEFLGTLTQGADSVIDMRMFDFYAYTDVHNENIALEVQSAPIYANTNADGVAVMTLTIV